MSRRVPDLLVSARTNPAGPLSLGICACVLAGVLSGWPAPLVAAPSEPAGVWTGTWERDGSMLDVDMTFSRNASGYVGAFSSSQLRVSGMPLAAVKYEAPQVTWQVAGDETTSSFEGTLDGDALNGTFHDGTGTGTFALTRGEPTATSAREEDISFSNGAVKLGGSVVLPAGHGPFAAVVFLPGASGEKRWVSRYLAHEFARRGIAGLIYDARDAAVSTGDGHTAGLADLVSDATAAVEAMRARSDIAPDRVGIHGHGQGATIAPWVASADPRVAFVAASGGDIGIPGYDALAYWRQITVPVGLLYGEQDERVAPRLSAQRISDAYLGAKGPRLGVMFFPLADRDYRWRPESNGKFAWPRTVPDYPARLIDWALEVSKPCACHLPDDLAQTAPSP
jgi:dienelactone hydrolase